MTHVFGLDRGIRARRGGNIGLGEFSDGHIQFEVLMAHSGKCASWWDVQA